MAKKTKGGIDVVPAESLLAEELAAVVTGVESVMTAVDSAVSDIESEEVSDGSGATGLAEVVADEPPPSDAEIADILGTNETIGRAGRPVSDLDEGEMGYAGPKVIPPSPFALEQDKWGERKGREMVAKGGVLEAFGISPEAAADFHTVAFEPAPVLTEKCADPFRQTFLKNVLESQEYKEMSQYTILNPDAAEIATAHFSNSYVKLVKELAETADDGSRRSEMKRSLQTGRAAAEAAKGAKTDIDSMETVGNAFGLDSGPGGKMDYKKASEIFKKIRKDSRLRGIIDEAGRFRMVSQSRRRNRVKHGTDEVVGLEFGSDISRLVPAELTALSSGVEEFELDALRRIAESQAVQFQMRATAPVGRGPVVVVVDESGSMDGAKIQKAKGLALSVAWTARQQKRWVGLVGFSSGCDGTLCVLPPTGWDDKKLFSWLEHFYGNGTSLDVPIQELPFKYWPKLIESGATRGKTDIIIITDAIVNAPQPMIDKFNDWRKQEQARVTTLVIESQPGDMAKVSDVCHLVRTLDADDESVASTLDI